MKSFYSLALMGLAASKEYSNEPTCSATADFHSAENSRNAFSDFAHDSYFMSYDRSHNFKRASRYCKDIGAMLTMPKTDEDFSDMMHVQIQGRHRDYFIGIEGSYEKVGRHSYEWTWTFVDGEKVDDSQTRWAKGYPKNTRDHNKVVSTQNGWKNVHEFHYAGGVNCQYTCDIAPQPEPEPEPIVVPDMYDFCAVCGTDEPDHPCLMPAPFNPSQFVKCSDGLPYILDCPSGQVWHEAELRCDWPAEQPIPDDIPEPVPVDPIYPDSYEFCAFCGTDEPGHPCLTAAPREDQFVKCAYGLPYVMDCPPGQVWHEELLRCDW